MSASTSTPDRTVWAWQCQTCTRSCVPVRNESRCLCGHRLKEHGPACKGSKCNSARCACKGFFFIVAEGAWVLRCRCKHKHTEHDPATRRCAKPSCSCKGFDSPWVCNCDHPWSDHKQVLVQQEISPLFQQLALSKAAAAAAAAADGSAPAALAAAHHSDPLSDVAAAADTALTAVASAAAAAAAMAGASAALEVGRWDLVRRGREGE